MIKEIKWKATSNCMTPSTDLILCKHVTYVFSASHTLYQSKMASVTVRNRKKNTKNITRCKLKGRRKRTTFLRKKQPQPKKSKGSRNHDFHTGHWNLEWMLVEGNNNKNNNNSNNNNNKTTTITINPIINYHFYGTISKRFRSALKNCY